MPNGREDLFPHLATMGAKVSTRFSLGWGGELQLSRLRIPNQPPISPWFLPWILTNVTNLIKANHNKETQSLNNNEGTKLSF
jgi:hypothetical protein